VNSPSKSAYRLRRALEYRAEYDAGAGISELMLTHRASYNTVYALLELAGTAFRTNHLSATPGTVRTTR
jgi:hypothetical protein